MVNEKWYGTELVGDCNILFFVFIILICRSSCLLTIDSESLSIKIFFPICIQRFDSEKKISQLMQNFPLFAYCILNCFDLYARHCISFYTCKPKFRFLFYFDLYFFVIFSIIVRIFSIFFVVWGQIWINQRSHFENFWIMLLKY